MTSLSTLAPTATTKHLKFHLISSFTVSDRDKSEMFHLDRPLIVTSDDIARIERLLKDNEWVIRRILRRKEVIFMTARQNQWLRHGEAREWVDNFLFEANKLVAPSAVVE